MTREIEQLRETVNNHDQVERNSNLQWTKRVDGLEHQLEKQKSTNASLVGRMRQLEEEKQELTREINRLHLIIKDLQSEKVNRIAGEKRIKELERKLEITQADLNAKAHESTSLKRQAASLNRQINYLKMEIAKYRSLQEQDKQSIARLNKELSHANVQLAECRKENASFKTTTELVDK